MKNLLSTQDLFISNLRSVFTSLIDHCQWHMALYKAISSWKTQTCCIPFIQRKCHQRKYTRDTWECGWPWLIFFSCCYQPTLMTADKCVRTFSMLGTKTYCCRVNQYHYHSICGFFSEKSSSQGNWVFFTLISIGDQVNYSRENLLCIDYEKLKKIPKSVTLFRLFSYVRALPDSLPSWSSLAEVKILALDWLWDLQICLPLRKSIKLTFRIILNISKF